MDKIFFERMKFYGYHGVFAEENRLGQRFIIDLELFLDLKSAAQGDSLVETVNYAEVYEVVRQEVEGTQVKLMETLAENIAQRLLSFAINEVVIKVTKPDPPIAGHYRSVGVEIKRRREL